MGRKNKLFLKKKKMFIEKMVIEPRFGLLMCRGCAFIYYAILVIQKRFYTILKRGGGE